MLELEAPPARDTRELSVVRCSTEVVATMFEDTMYEELAAEYTPNAASVVAEPMDSSTLPPVLDAPPDAAPARTLIAPAAALEDAVPDNSETEPPEPLELVAAPAASRTFPPAPPAVAPALTMIEPAIKPELPPVIPPPDNNISPPLAPPPPVVDVPATTLMAPAEPPVDAPVCNKMRPTVEP